ncbi:hypothetical protein CFP56_032776 [Quercus suber]|uniref:Uncharacterized protein n=1 Tax=Quercus suber TaxID=58331 RepID=A0AAW0JGJ7_QUESU
MLFIYVSLPVLSSKISHSNICSYAKTFEYHFDTINREFPYKRLEIDTGQLLTLSTLISKADDLRDINILEKLDN